MNGSFRLAWATGNASCRVVLLCSSVLIGPLAHAASVSTPDSAQAGGDNAVAVGDSANAPGPNGVAIGASASAGRVQGGTRADSIAIGHNATASEGSSIALGTGASGTDPNSISIGSDAASNAPHNVVIGMHSRSFGIDGVAVGTNTRADGASSVAIGGITGDGAETVATGVRAVAIGSGAAANGLNSVVIGQGANATAQGGLAIGSGATNIYQASIALGSGSQTQAAVKTASGTIAGQTYDYAGANPGSTVSVGSANAKRTITNVAAGRVGANSTDAVNGSQLYATHQAINGVNQRVTNVQGDVNNLGDEIDRVNGSAVKYDTSNGNVDRSRVTFNGNDGTTLTNVAAGDVAQGSMDAVNGNQLWKVQNRINAVAASSDSRYLSVNSSGPAATASGSEAVAAGPRSVASGDNSVAAGNGATATSDGGVALGAGSRATRQGMDGARERFSGQKVASTRGAVSVGSDGGERQITHVAGGTQATDAANIRQLQAVQAGSVNYDRNANGSVDYSSITLGNGNGPTQIHNVAPGTAGTDAVNVNQLRSFGNDVNGRFDALNERLHDVREDAEAGTASAIAIASIPQAYQPGKSMIAGGVGTFQGAGGFAVGLSSLSDNGHWAVKLNGTVNTRGDGGVGGGLGYQW